MEIQMIKMNRFYGTGISTEMQREIHSIQNKYGLNDLQTAGILMAFDFACRVASLDHDNLHDVRLVTYKHEGHHNAEDTVSKLPPGVHSILGQYATMQAAANHFCSMNGHKVIKRFADKLFEKRLVLADYLAPGVLKIRPIDVEVVRYDETRG